MIEEAIGRVVEGEELSGELARVVMMEMMEGDATASQIGSFITAMRMKGESEEELASFLQVMRDKARTVSAPPGAVDLCGTGGDGAGTFNISTTASFVVAGAGVPVAKHGNTSVSSRSGSADVLSSMGVGVDQPPQVVERCIHRVGLGFMYAPVFHRSMKNVQVPRKQVAIRTFFNLLGPMANPAEVDRQLVGVYDPDLVPVMARVLKKMGSSRVMVVNGDGMDEITNTGTTRVAELKDGHIDYFEIIPTDFGLETVDIEHIKGGGPHQNAQIMRSIFEGERSPRTDIVALNSGATLYLAGKADTLEDGVELAFQTIEEGRALAKLNQFLDFMKDVESKKGRDSAGEGSSIDGGGRVRALFKELRESEKGRRVLETFDRKIIERPNILTEVVLNRAVSLLSEDGENEMKRGRRDRSSYSLVERLSGEDHLSVIAEYKPRSPSSDYSPLGAAEMAQVYVDCGASGV